LSPFYWKLIEAKCGAEASKWSTVKCSGNAFFSLKRYFTTMSGGKMKKEPNPLNHVVNAYSTVEETRAYIVKSEDGMYVADATLAEELDLSDCTIVTEVEKIVAEGYNSGAGIHVLKGEDGKFYVVYSHEGRGYGHDTPVIAVLDDFRVLTRNRKF
jgi:biotin operon repressor